MRRCARRANSVAAVLGAALSLAGAAFTSPARADCDHPFDDPNDVLDFHLSLARADWDALRNDTTDYLCGEGRQTYPARFRCGDQTPISIGVRIKRGQQRGLSTDQKPPLRLDFNAAVATQYWPQALGDYAFTSLALNMGNYDQTDAQDDVLLPEHFAWRLMRREVPVAPSSAYAQLFVGLDDQPSVEEYHGLYIIVEDINRRAIARRFRSTTGKLLKTTNSDCQDDIVYDDGPPNQASDLFVAWNDASPGGDWWAQTDAAMDLESALRQEAIRELIGNQRDTLMGRNFSNFLSFDPAQGRRVYIPWDLDDAFDLGEASDDLLTPEEYQCAPGSFGSRTRCEPSIRARYEAIVCQLVSGSLSRERLLEEWDAIDRMIRPLVAKEAASVWGGSDPTVLAGALYQRNYQWMYDRGRAFIQARIDHVATQLGCAPCTDGSTESCSYLTCSGQRHCNEGSWTPCLPDNGVCGPFSVSADGSFTTAATALAAPETADRPASGCSVGSPQQGSNRAWLGAAALSFLAVCAHLTRRRRASQSAGRARPARRRSKRLQKLD